MYDYLREIPPSYRQEYNSLVVNDNHIGDSVKYQLIILSYKEENCIGDCVESLINQTISPDEFEVLIINNCSYEEEFDNTVDNMSSMIEPIMIVFMGIMIGGLMIAMYSPIFNVGALIG